MNIQSVGNKIDLVQCDVINRECDILILSETWVNECETQLYEINKYKALSTLMHERYRRRSVHIPKRYNQISRN